MPNNRTRRGVFGAMCNAFGRCFRTIKNTRSEYNRALNSLGELRRLKREAILNARAYTPGWRRNFQNKREASGANNAGIGESNEEDLRGGKRPKRNRTYKRR